MKVFANPIKIYFLFLTTTMFHLQGVAYGQEMSSLIANTKKNCEIQMKSNDLISKNITTLESVFDKATILKKKVTKTKNMEKLFNQDLSLIQKRIRSVLHEKDNFSVSVGRVIDKYQFYTKPEFIAFIKDVSRVPSFDQVGLSILNLTGTLTGQRIKDLVVQDVEYRSARIEFNQDKNLSQEEREFFSSSVWNLLAYHIQTLAKIGMRMIDAGCAAN